MAEDNKVNKKCFDIRNAIIKEKIKLRNITLIKCFIIDDMFYYKDRL